MECLSSSALQVHCDSADGCWGWLGSYGFASWKLCSGLLFVCPFWGSGWGHSRYSVRLFLWPVTRVERARWSCARPLKAFACSMSADIPLAKAGNGNPLQCSFLGNLMDIGSWWATVHGFTESGWDAHTEALEGKEVNRREKVKRQHTPFSVADGPLTGRMWLVEGEGKRPSIWERLRCVFVC